MVNPLNVDLLELMFFNATSAAFFRVLHGLQPACQRL